MIPLDHGKQSVSELAYTKKYMLPLRDQFRNREISEIYFSRSGLDLQAWEEVSSDSQNDRSQRRYIKGLGWNCILWIVTGIVMMLQLTMNRLKKMNLKIY